MNLHILALLLFALPLAAQSKPNFIVIFADDLGYGDLSAFGATAHETPHLDKMAADGMRLTEFYVPMPFCGPSRAPCLRADIPSARSWSPILRPMSAGTALAWRRRRSRLPKRSSRSDTPPPL